MSTMECAHSGACDVSVRHHLSALGALVVRHSFPDCSTSMCTMYHRVWLACISVGHPDQSSCLISRLCTSQLALDGGWVFRIDYVSSHCWGCTMHALGLVYCNKSIERTCLYTRAPLQPSRYYFIENCAPATCSIASSLQAVCDMI
jgi:hypothetical protein